MKTLILRLAIWLSLPLTLNAQTFSSGLSGATFTPGTLSGTEAASTVTLAVSGLSRTNANFLIASVEFSLSANVAARNPKGADYIAKVRINTPLGERQKATFLRGDGLEVEPAKVPRPLLQLFAQ